MVLDAEDQHHDDAEQALSMQPKQSGMMVNNKTRNDDALRDKDLKMVLRDEIVPGFDRLQLRFYEETNSESKH